MKAEDIYRLWNESQQHPEPVRLERFARACEQHGIERAKALARVHNCDSCEGGNHEPIDWSALDAEIAKENEE